MICFIIRPTEFKVDLTLIPDEPSKGFVTKVCWRLKNSRFHFLYKISI